jgi:hypothetical protein
MILFSIMFSIRDNVFSNKKVISRNTLKNKLPAESRLICCSSYEFPEGMRTFS